MVKIDQILRCTISYRPGKGNIVTDALSRKERLNMLTLPFKLWKETESLELEIKDLSLEGKRLYEMLLQPELLRKDKEIPKESDGEANEGIDIRKDTYV